jgi:hypothetical protein
VLQLKVLILELLAVNGFSASAIPSSKITALDHKLLDHAVEKRSFEVQWLSTLAYPLLTRAERPEVFGGSGHDIVEKLKDDTPGRPTANGDVEKDTTSLLCLFGCHLSAVLDSRVYFAANRGQSTKCPIFSVLWRWECEGKSAAYYHQITLENNSVKESCKSLSGYLSELMFVGLVEEAQLAKMSFVD